MHLGPLATALRLSSAEADYDDREHTAASSSGLEKCDVLKRCYAVYSFKYNQQDAMCTVLELLMMGGETARNM